MKKIYLSFFSLLVFLSASAQSTGFVGIGTTTPKAKLQVSSDTSGILIPKYATLALANTQTLTKLNSTDHKGLMIYVDEAANQGFWYYNGTAFTKVGGGSPAATDVSNVFSGHQTVMTGVNYTSPLQNTSSTVLGSTTTFIAPATATYTIKISSYAGSAYTIDLVDVTPNATNTFTVNTVLATANIPAYVSGAANTATLTVSITAGKIISLRSSATTAVGVYYTATSVQ